MTRVTRIEGARQSEGSTRSLKVAAYCRVSTDSDKQLESLEAQKKHYARYIKRHADWQFVGIYYDSGISGTKAEKRPELIRLVSDCKAGKVDFIVTKSISRFARNTVDCLDISRRLLELKVPIYFEKENINTSEMESELFLSILSTMAAGESVSISQNCKWSVLRRFENRTFKISSPPYGYDWTGDKMTLNQQQAAIVKRIFSETLSGKSSSAVANGLNSDLIPSKRNRHWTEGTILAMLSNEKYTGNCMFQKTYTDGSFKQHRNRGEQNRYLAKNHHEAIISDADFNAAAALVRERASEKGVEAGNKKYRNRYPFTNRIICGECGCTFKRRIHQSASSSRYTAWCCKTHIEDKTKCSMLFIKDEAIKSAFVTMMNKLVFSHKFILAPFLEAIQSTTGDESLRRIQQIQTALLQNAEKRGTLQTLAARGVLDQAIFTRESNALLRQADELKAETDVLSNPKNGEVSIVAETAALLHFAEKDVMLDVFDEELFKKFVDHILVKPRSSLRFVLRCGLTLEERV